MKEIKLDLSNGKLNIIEQLIKEGFELSEKREKIVITELERLKIIQEQKLITEKEINDGINEIMFFIILNAMEVQE